MVLPSRRRHVTISQLTLHGTAAMRISSLVLLLLSSSLNAEESLSGVLIYGGTPAGIAAAIAAAKDGESVTLVEPTSRIGGLVTNGLSHTDFRTFEGLNGAFLDFTKRVEQHYAKTYGKSSQQVKDSFRGTFGEPGVNLAVFQAMLAEQKSIRVVTGLRLVGHLGETLLGKFKIDELDFVDAKGKAFSFRAKVFIDATYEGDLMAVAGVPWVAGREGKAKYGESLAPDQPDSELQAYNFRWIMTRDEKNRVTPKEPAGYSREDFLPVLEILKAGKIQRVFGYQSGCIFKAHLPPLPNDKFDINDVSNGIIRLSLPGQNLKWPDGTEDDRAKIYNEHLRDQVGLLYFLQNDADVPEKFRNEAKEWGWCKDEFAENGHLPLQLYVREARRMVGRHVYTEKDSEHAPGDARSVRHPEAIAIGDYGNNCHGTAHEPPRFGGKHTGEFYKVVPPYQIPYGVIVPTKVTNLLVVGAVSSSHVGYCALRLEPIWSSLGQAAGHAAHLVIAEKKPVQDVPVAKLQTRLHGVGSAIVYFSDVLPGHADYAAVQWWGTAGGFHGLAATPPKNTIRGKNIVGQYYEAFPHHAAELDKVLDNALSMRWLALGKQIGLDSERLPRADGKLTRGDWIRSASRLAR